ncbi:MAG: orotidine-5'-phosphate decarboxylase [Bryobacterales bacterium]|nr:orotidine-5'-phosphate decarboxylase [Bryobacterales bacterium]
MSKNIDAKERLIAALDLPGVAQARQKVEELEGVVSFFKIGLTLQLAPGVEQLIQELIRSGRRVFLDYKYYDIPETVKTAVSRAVDLGVSFLTVHGSTPVIQGAVKGRGSSPLKLFAVTVLTSMDKADLAELGYENLSVEELVLFRARKALEAGCDGVIASGREARQVKALAGGRRLLVVTPGIRPDGYAEDDQKRRTTPADAIVAGADYLVIGRPIVGAAEPREAAERILAEMREAFERSVPPGRTAGKGAHPTGR